MASLIENLITVLKEENEAYEVLLGLSREKTPVIIQGELEALQKITDEEQNVIGRINRLEAKREEYIRDIANVINRDVAELKLINLIALLAKSPAEQKCLAEIHDKLQVTLQQMSMVNEQNRELLQNSMDMVRFDLNLLQAARKAPETANYNRGAYNTGAEIGKGGNGFDAKQ